jgi:tripartite-type tricarboxylate transporter receptor subunit TctC
MLTRRNALQLAASAVAMPFVSTTGRAQAYPSRPVKLVVPYPPGGGSDIYSRMMTPWLSERLGQQFIIENRPGAAGNVGTEAVARAAPDGYTILNVNAAHAINANLYDKLNFNILRDIAPIAGLITEPQVLAVNPRLGVKTVADLIAHAKANPGKINFASSGAGSSQHLAGELLKMMTGTNMVHVPYRGMAPALSDVIGGQVQCTFAGLTVALEHLRAGTLHPVAVASLTRSAALPDTPTLDEFVKGFESSLWFGFGAPRGTSKEIVERLNKEINAGLADPSLRAKLTATGATILSLSATEFGEKLVSETEKWGNVIRTANIKPD